MQNRLTKSVLIKLGQRLRTSRQEKSISQEELAAIAGLHRTYIGMIERGEKNVTITSLITVCKALGIDVSDVLKNIENGE